jgi:hypothetical protein
MTTFKKSVAAFVLAAAMFGVVGSAKAQTPTIESLMAQIAALTAQIAQMQGGSSTGSTTCGTTYGYTATSTLKAGMSGSAVSAFQTALNNFGGASLSVDGSFGPATAAAVKAFQTSKGLSADGVAGPATQGALATASMTAGSNCDNDNGTTPSGDLNGGAGDLTYTAASEFSGEEVGEGEEEVSVMSFDAEADDESDVEVTSVKVEFVESGSTSSEDLTDYASEVSVWYNGEMVGSADADDFNESSDIYSKSISLDGVVIEAGEEETLTIAVSALSNLDSGDIDSDAWSVDVTQVRFVDGDGVVTTDNTDGDSFDKSFDFVDFATATDAELSVDLENEDINDARVLNVDDNTDTEHEILSFTLEAEGDSDIWVDEIPVVITTTGETTEATIIIEASLWDGNDKIASSSIGTDGAVLFDDLDMTIDAGDTKELVVMVEVQDIDGALDAGDTVQATVTVASIDAEDEEGNAITATGAAAADAHAMYDIGFELAFVSATEVKTVTSDTSGTGDQAQFIIKYDITAFDGDIYIDNTCTEDNNGSEVATTTSFSITNDGSNSVSCVMTAEGTDTDSTDSANTFLVDENDTREFTLTVNATASADAFAQVSLQAIGWDVAAGGDNFVFDFDLPGDFKTDPLFLNLF